MSIEYLTAVWKDEYYTEKDKTKLLVALAIADCADGNGYAFPGVEYIAKKSRSTARFVQIVCRELQTDGKLEIQAGKGRNGTNLYRLLGVKLDHPAGKPISDKVVKPFQGEAISGRNRVTAEVTARLPAEVAPQITQTVRNHQEPSGSVRKQNITMSLVEFDQFWKIYPRKVGKEHAREAWLKAKVTFEECRPTIEAWAKSEDWQKDGGRFCPHAATWLNKKRWTDEPPPTAKAQSLNSAPLGKWGI